MNICRICKEWKSNPYHLIKYGPRHYAHPDCGLKLHGVNFFNKLSEFELRQFPFYVAKHAGLELELEKRLPYNPRLEWVKH